MIDYSESKVLHVSAHVVGNGVNGEKLKLSSETLETEDDALQNVLLTYFLSSFNAFEYYRFTFTNDQIAENGLYKLVSEIFEDPDSLHENSINIASHLYAVTLLPNIKSGDLYVAYLSGVRIQNQVYNAIGIFKSENKDSYLKLNTTTPSFKLKADNGINIRKLDKGCLILDVEQEEGYKILVVDNRNANEAHFWMNDFLQVKPLADNFHHTQNFMNLTRQYVDEQLDEEFSVSKADKIELLNRSRNFFKTKDQFNQHEFEAEVLEDPSVIESFRNYESTLISRNESDIVDNFEISAHAVKKQLRVFKSVLKLDKNFHIYIHGNRQLIEKGFDEDIKKHYYKIYFDEET
ncbi:nucleoid-associated protein [Chryseolinea sp. H1M3-3]|uniref:nucleoid-associated protein n=1 Tax=Chryseolinea sp. H1M3-3 TaxID=3034144 RepID=UPI0023ECCB8A|nr:nucleoid-associated protein [Chryseolinea sp. H1M3-3]